MTKGPLHTQTAQVNQIYVDAFELGFIDGNYFLHVGNVIASQNDVDVVIRSSYVINERTAIQLFDTFSKIKAAKDAGVSGQTETPNEPEPESEIQTIAVRPVKNQDSASS